MGPSWVDPRSGEILNASVYVYHDVMKLLNNWLFVQTAQADERVRAVTIPEEVIGDGLRYVVAHEVGHCLGYMHNMSASAVIPVDSLRSPSFTQKYGTTTSIMDYARFNYVARPGDRERGVKLTPPRFGLYDYYAVKWLYTPVPDAATAADEYAVTSKWITGAAADSVYRFGKQQFSRSIDPRSQSEDLGDDAVKASGYGIANLKYVAEHGDGWLSGRDGDYKFREELLTEMVLRVNSLALQLMRYIGGVYMNPVYEGTARPACTAVPREVQRRALREALALTADLGWIDRQGVSKNVYNRVQACEYLQRRIARTLLEKLGTLDLAASKADDPYTADLMAKDLVAWFEERLRSREPLTDHVRNLQQSLLKSTVAAANVKDKPSSGSGSAFALFDGAGSLSDGGDLFPAADAGTLPDMPAERRADDFTPLGAGEVQGAAYGYRTPRVIPAFREHLFYGLLLDMKAMYRRGAASAPLADTRSFCRYMADRIDRELAVE